MCTIHICTYTYIDSDGLSCKLGFFQPRRGGHGNSQRQSARGRSAQALDDHGAATGARGAAGAVADLAKEPPYRSLDPQDRSTTWREWNRALKKEKTE